MLAPKPLFRLRPLLHLLWKSAVGGVAVLISLFLIISPLHAQEGLLSQNGAEPPKNALSGTIEQIAEKILANPAARKPASANAGTKVSVEEKYVYIPTLVKALGSSDEEKKNLTQLLETTVTSFIASSQKPRNAQDLAEAVAFFLMVQWAILHEGKEASEAGLNRMTEQLRMALDTPAVQKASNSDKQALFEYCVGMGGFTLAMYAAGKEGGNTELARSMKEVAGKLMTFFLRVEPNQVAITENGLSISGTVAKAPSSASPASSTGVSTATIAFKDPSGWKKEVKDGMTIFSTEVPKRNEYDEERHDVRIMVLPAVAAANAPDTEAEKLFSELVEGYRKHPGHEAQLVQRSWNFRYLLENGVACYAISGRLQPKNEDARIWFTQYLLDFGNAYVPVLRVHTRFNETTCATFRSIGNTGFGSDDDRGFGAEAVEDFIRTVSMGGANPSRPLFEKSLLLGKWSTTSSVFNSTNYYSTSTGAFVGNVTNLISSGTRWTLGEDGTAEYYFASSVNGKITTERITGTWKLQGNRVLISGKSSYSGKQETRQELVVFYGKDPKTNKPFFVTTDRPSGVKENPVTVMELTTRSQLFVPQNSIKD
ncbi:MAG: hypothetical protein OHK0029_35720 [Armatimonadaceae bacterium]